MPKTSAVNLLILFPGTELLSPLEGWILLTEQGFYNTRWKLVTQKRIRIYFSNWEPPAAALIRLEVDHCMACLIHSKLTEIGRTHYITKCRMRSVREFSPWSDRLCEAVLKLRDKLNTKPLDCADKTF